MDLPSPFWCIVERFQVCEHCVPCLRNVLLHQLYKIRPTEIDGVFSMWYGKGPGLDRAMDALRHANMGGVSSKGGMILAVAEDPIGKSSTLAYQSEQSLISAGIPVFYPANVNEVISMGLQAFALSRHAGICVGLKITGDTADSNAVIDMGLIRPKLLILAKFRCLSSIRSFNRLNFAPTSS